MRIILFIHIISYFCRGIQKLKGRMGGGKEMSDWFALYFCKESVFVNDNLRKKMALK